MNRRGFLSSILALAAAPAIVRADSLMRVIPVTTTVLPAAVVEPVLTGEAALIAVIRKVWEAGGEPDIIRCSPEFARVIDAEFAGAATKIAYATHRRIPEPVSLYVSDYGCSRIVVDRGMARDFIVEAA